MRNQKNYNLTLFFTWSASICAGAFFMFALLPNLALAAGQTYYISPNGSDAGTGSITSPLKTFQKAYGKVKAGDTLIVRGGTYSDVYWHPVAAGTASAPITIKAYPGETPVITGKSTYNVIFNLTSWFIIEGLHFENITDGYHIISATNASYLTVRNCVFYNSPGNQILVMGGDHVVIENNTFIKTGYPADRGEGSNIYMLGMKNGLVQNNYFKQGGHAAVDVIDTADKRPSEFNIIRNNTIEQGWGGGIYLTRGTKYTVVEGNIIKYAGQQVNYPKDAIQIASEGNIVRNNLVLETSASPAGFNDNGIDILGYVYQSREQSAIRNRIYNNVLYKVGHVPIMISQRGPTQVTDNKVVNNILYRNRVGGDFELYAPPGNYYLFVELYHALSTNKWAAFPNDNYFFNNLILHADAKGDYPGTPSIAFYDAVPWVKSLTQLQADFPNHFKGNTEKNPKFKSPDQGDFTTQVGSPAIDGGTNLARTVAAGTNTTAVPVDDPYFFTDGFGVTEGDLVKVGSNSPVRVKAVDYNAKILNLASPVSFASGAAVNLTFNGSAPDMGILETFTITPVTPAALASSDSGSPTQNSLPGDFNNDGIVNSLDLSLLASRWNQNYSAYDLHMDGVINTLDFAVMSFNWGRTR